MPFAKFNPCKPCCNICQYLITFRLNWPSGNNSDLDLYVKNVTNSGTCYFGNPNVVGLTLNNDAHPTCAITPNQPEIISGVFTTPHIFEVWYNQYSSCTPFVSGSQVTREIIVENQGNQDLYFNEYIIGPGQSVNYGNKSFSSYAGYNTGDMSNYGISGDCAVVSCATQCGLCQIGSQRQVDLGNIVWGGSGDNCGQSTCVQLSGIHTLNYFERSVWCGWEKANFGSGVCTYTIQLLLDYDGFDLDPQYIPGGWWLEIANLGADMWFGRLSVEEFNCNGSNTFKKNFPYRIGSSLCSGFPETLTVTLL